MSLLLLEENKNVKFGGLVWYKLYMNSECIFHVFA